MAALDPDHEADTTFASVVDLMVGLLFVFLLLLVFFALEYKAATAELTDAQASRGDLLAALERQLQAQDVRAASDPELGVLRLPEEALFDKGSATLTEAGKRTVEELASALRVVLACQLQPAAACPPGTDEVETIFIEGHTDSDPLAPGGRFADNWELSAARALATYRALLVADPALAAAKSEDGGSLFGVSGYGPDRPAALGGGEEDKRRNRRIDVRLLMRAPEAAS